MSDIVEKTFGTIQNLLSNGGTTIKNLGATSGLKSSGAQYKPCWSRGFNSFLELLGGTTSKYEEQQLVKNELSVLQQHLSEPSIKTTQIREYLVRAMYCEMLGYPAPFAYIHAIKLAQQGSLHEKNIGYLASSLFLHEKHELVVLLVNTVQKDLQSSNTLEVCLALRVVCSLISSETALPIIPLLDKLVTHPKEIVRKKAVQVLYHLLRKNPSFVSSYTHTFHKALSDPDPGVMTASLCIFEELILKDPSKHQNLVPCLIQIQNQVLNQKLPEDYSYHGIPAPWIQVQVLRMLAVLGRDNEASSNAMTDVLCETLKRATLNQNAVYAIVYECIRTATSIVVNKTLLQLALSHISKFLRSQNNNLKYTGLTALGEVIRAIQPVYAAEHQSIVIECLYHPDESLRRKTLDLLYKMANSSNVQVICAKMLEYISTTNDEYLKKSLVNHIIELTDQFSPDLEWSIQTVNSLLLKVGHLVKPQVVDDIMFQLQKGTEDKDLDLETHQFAVRTYFNYVQTRGLPDGLLQLIAWVLGEFSHLSIEVPPQLALEELSSLAQSHWHSEAVLPWILEAILKLILITEFIPDNLLPVLQSKVIVEASDIKQMLKEITMVIQNLSSFSDSFSIIDEVTKADFTLSFLDSYVIESVASTGVPFKPTYLKTKQEIATEKQLSFSNCGFQLLQSPSVTVKKDPTVASSLSSTCSSEKTSSSASLPISLTSEDVKQVWTKEGRVKSVGKKPKKESSSTDLKEIEPSSTELSSLDEEKQLLAKALFCSYENVPSRSAISKMPNKVAQMSTQLPDKKESPDSSDGTRLEAVVAAATSNVALSPVVSEPKPDKEHPLVTKEEEEGAPSSTEAALDDDRTLKQNLVVSSMTVTNTETSTDK